MEQKEVHFGGASGAVEGFGGAARYDLEELRFIIWEELLLGRLGRFLSLLFDGLVLTDVITPWRSVGAVC